MDAPDLFNGAVLDGETLRRVNAQQGYKYRGRQKYLQEDDRVEIIRRVANGEKQSELAREFGVTRAAICNTYKNRDEILARSRHVYEAQLARAEQHHSKEDGRVCETKDHPTTSTSRKRRLGGEVRCEREDLEEARAQRQSTNEVSYDRRSEPDKRIKVEPRVLETADCAWRLRQTSLDDRVGRFYELWTPAARLLVTRLHDSSISPSEFRVVADRLIRLLLEEALVTVSIEAYAWVAAVGVGNGSYPILRCYQAMRPDEPVGLVQFDEALGSLRVAEVMLPARAKPGSSILLMTCECSSGPLVGRSIDELQQRGLEQSRIYIVAVIMSDEAWSYVTSHYPGGPHCPPGFLSRYYHV